MSNPRLQVIIGSTRPGRVGPVIAAWFADRARGYGGFEVELVDLAEVNLPLLDEPNHPRLAQYQHEHTKRWSEIVTRGDAYAFVVPEYNHSMNAAVKNAIDFLHHEWHYTPVGNMVGAEVVANAIRSFEQFPSLPDPSPLAVFLGKLGIVAVCCACLTAP